VSGSFFLYRTQIFNPPLLYFFTGVLIFHNPTPIILTKLNDDLKNSQPGNDVDNRLSSGEKLVQKEKVFGNEF
jgi:hypothetical protein